MSHTTATRYLITHDRCDCRVLQPVGLHTRQEVATWFWDRNMLDHVVYEGECPYRFPAAARDLDLIASILGCFPAWLLRKKDLPFPIHDQGTLLCTIGNTTSMQTSFFWRRWLWSLKEGRQP